MKKVKILFSAAALVIASATAFGTTSKVDPSDICNATNPTSIAEVNALCPQDSPTCCTFTRTVTLQTGNPDQPTTVIHKGTTFTGVYSPDQN